MQRISPIVAQPNALIAQLAGLYPQHIVANFALLDDTALLPHDRIALHVQWVCIPRRQAKRRAFIVLGGGTAPLRGKAADQVASVLLLVLT